MALNITPAEITPEVLVGINSGCIDQTNCLRCIYLIKNDAHYAIDWGKKGCSRRMKRLLFAHADPTIIIGKGEGCPKKQVKLSSTELERLYGETSFVVGEVIEMPHIDLIKKK